MRSVKVKLFEDMNPATIPYMYATTVRGYYFERFTSDPTNDRLRHDFTFFDLYNYFILNVRYMLENEDFNLESGPVCCLGPQFE